ncbi:transient receptor potential channel pyrexia-like [Pollicipes pollicipes]|uniref:transient receptor potential channel pyrexia-like n=1 Tax=Pollicipes pollicipes TaxID=41117 RepID=UPI00188586B0|nr:transient receptor potential channel pyrexia-like [Pollicipes pollicipes]
MPMPTSLMPLAAEADLSEDEDVLQALLPGQLSSQFLLRRMDEIVRRSVSHEDDAKHQEPAAGTSQQQRLFNACLTGDTQLATAALDAGADPNADMRAVSKTSRKRTRLSGDNKRPHTRLQSPRRQQTLPSLLRRNILLHLVTSLGDCDMLDLLLRRGADPATPDAVGDTALHVVSRVHHPIDVTIELVRLLREADAPLEATNMAGLTPLHQAAAAGNTAALLTLVELGARCAGQDARGNTLLHAAVTSGCASTVSAALDRLPAAALHQPNKAGRTPLQQATNRETVRLLLAAGARGDEPTTLTLLQNVPSAVPDVFEHYMTTNNRPLDSSELEVYLDYMPFWDAERQHPAPETGVLRAIVDADQDELLKHPLVETFLHIKWLQVRRFFIFNFAFYVCFALLVTGYGMMCVMQPYAAATKVLACISGLLTIAAAIRETFQLLYSWRLYVRSVENWLELVIIVLNSALLIGHNSYGGWVHHTVAWLMLTVWLEMTLMVGRFPSIGIYIYMFVRVAQKLVGFLLVYSPLLVAFALSFQVLFGDKTAFHTIPHALIKTFVMMMGEYDYDGMFSNDESIVYPGTSHFVLILFVVSMSIITVNLLIGLTVNDIQGLFKTAGVQRLRMTVIQILYIESVIYSNVLYTVFRSRICQRMQAKLTLLPKLLLRQVDNRLSGQPAAATTCTPADKTENGDSSGEGDDGERILRASFRPNIKGHARLYRTAGTGDLRPTRYVIHNWMVRNMLALLRGRAADADRETREQLLQAEILAAVRAKTGELGPFYEMPEAELGPDSAPASGRQTPAAGDGDGDDQAQPEGAGRSRRGRRRRKKAMASRDSLEELGQKLNTVLAAVAEVSLKMGIIERRLNLTNPPQLDTFYSV